MDETALDLLRCVAGLCLELQRRVIVLEEILVDSKLVDEKELELRLEQTTWEEKTQARADAAYRAVEDALKRLPIQ